MARKKRVKPDSSAALDAELQDEKPSKSAMKRQMTALQELGEALVALSDKELAKIPIDDERLYEVIIEARGIRSNSAKRRHLQFLGKLMRHVDPEPMESALNALHQARRDTAEGFQALEGWRDKLLEEGEPAIENLLAEFPSADRQQLRQLLRQHKKEVEMDKPAASARKIFRYLRDLAEAQSH